MLSHTSTEWAPWHVIPADRKWLPAIAASAVIADALIEIDPQYPTVAMTTRRELQKVKAALEAQAPAGRAPDPFEDRSNDGRGARRARRGDGCGGRVTTKLATACEPGQGDCQPAQRRPGPASGSPARPAG